MFESGMIWLMSLLRKLAVLGMAGLAALAIGGAVLIASKSGGGGGMTRPLLVVRPIGLRQAQPEPAKPGTRPRESVGKGARRSGAVGEGDNLWGEETAQLVIVIDDIGHNLPRARQFLKLNLPLTFSVLPGLKYSRRAAELIVAEGREFLVHLPMEPDDYPIVDPGPKPLLLAQGDAGIRERIGHYFARLPGAIGASNHMGSAYTRNAAKMRVVQSVLAARGGVFLNSLTSDSSVPRKIARANGFEYLERSIFLDNERDEGAIRHQLKRAIRLARREGSAIAIGHPYRETRRVLAARFPLSNAHDVRLVTLSALWGR